MLESRVIKSSLSDNLTSVNGLIAEIKVQLQQLFFFFCDLTLVSNADPEGKVHADNASDAIWKSDLLSIKNDINRTRTKSKRFRDLNTH